MVYILAISDSPKIINDTFVTVISVSDMKYSRIHFNIFKSPKQEQVIVFSAEPSMKE